MAIIYTGLLLKSSPERRIIEKKFKSKVYKIKFMGKVYVQLRAKTAPFF